MTSASIISTAPLSELIRKIETSLTADRDVSAHALAFVRDGVITGEGPTTTGRVHFSRALDAHDAAWCARILTAAANANEPISRAEAKPFSRSTKPHPSVATMAVSTTCSPRRSCIMRLRPPACRCRRALSHSRRKRRSKAGHPSRRSASTPKCLNGSRARCAASAHSNLALKALVATLIALRHCRWHRRCRRSSTLECKARVLR